MEQLTFRYATEQDCGLILHFIRELAGYEKMSGEVVATQDLSACKAERLMVDYWQRTQGG